MLIAMQKYIEAGDVFPTSEGGEVRVVKCGKKSVNNAHHLSKKRML